MCEACEWELIVKKSAAVSESRKHDAIAWHVLIRLPVTAFNRKPRDDHTTNLPKARGEVTPAAPS